MWEQIFSPGQAIDQVNPWTASGGPFLWIDIVFILFYFQVKTMPIHENGPTLAVKSFKNDTTDVSENLASEFFFSNFALGKIGRRGKSQFFGTSKKKAKQKSGQKRMWEYPGEKTLSINLVIARLARVLSPHYHRLKNECTTKALRWRTHPGSQRPTTHHFTRRTSHDELPKSTLR